jgi:NADPH2:quinone reductase
LLIDVHSAGVNYADTHQTEDSYLARQSLPLIPGGEVVGRVVGGERAGERVLAMVNGGGYAERVTAPAAMTFALDDRLSDAQALALLIQGTSAWHLLRTSTHFTRGETVVVHSAAGGVGNIAVQLARAWGAGRIIGTASGAEKCALVESLGADVALDISSTENAGQVTEALRAANHGRPIDVILEMTGGHVFDGSLAALRPLGRLAVFGMASRVPPSRVQIPALMAKSRAVIGFWLVHALGLPGGLQAPLEELTSMIHAGLLNPIIGTGYPLGAAAAAHEELRSRRTIGKLILTVSGATGSVTGRTAASATVPPAPTAPPAPVEAAPVEAAPIEVAPVEAPELVVQIPILDDQPPATGPASPWATTSEPTAAQLAAVESFGSASS